MRPLILATSFALFACTSSGADLTGPRSCPTDPPEEKSPGGPCNLPDGTTCVYRFGYTNPACGSRTAECTGGQWSVYHTEPGSSCLDSDAGADGDVAVSCPAQYSDVRQGGPCSLPDGTTCSYGDDLRCFGKFAQCTRGHWELWHNDPFGPGCRDTGVDVMPEASGETTGEVGEGDAGTDAPPG